METLSRSPTGERFTGEMAKGAHSVAEHMAGETVGPLIRRARNTEAYTQRGLAEALNTAAGSDTLTWNDVARWERGKRIPGHYWRHWLSTVLQIPQREMDKAAALAKQQRQQVSTQPEPHASESLESANTGGLTLGFSELLAGDPADTLESLSTGRHLVLPGGRSFTGSTAAVQVHPATRCDDAHVAIEVENERLLTNFLRRPQRGMIIGAITDPRGQVRHIGLEAHAARRQLARHQSRSATLSAPFCYELDSFTRAVLWAVANLDDALLTDDAELTQSCHELSTYEQMPGSAVSREAAPELTTISRMWLGSYFCARHILRNTGEFPDIPVFWTREQRGEEACTWLLFQHKYDYLRHTTERFAGSDTPLVRAFCIPEDAVHTSPPAERILLFLAAALMESFGIQTQACIEPEYSDVEGFVLAPQGHAIIANWIRSEGIWHVDTTARRSRLHDFTEAAGHARTHSIIDAPAPKARLTALASYLGLDWPWLSQRCAGFARYGWDGFLRPRNRLLSLAGLDQACRYVSTLRDPVGRQ